MFVFFYWESVEEKTFRDTTICIWIDEFKVPISKKNKEFKQHSELLRENELKSPLETY